MSVAFDDPGDVEHRAEGNDIAIVAKNDQHFVARLSERSAQRLLTGRLFHRAQDVAEQVRHMCLCLVGSSLSDNDGRGPHAHQTLEACFLDASPPNIFHVFAIDVFQIEGFCD